MRYNYDVTNIGNVTAIVNEKLFLFESNLALSPGDKIQVYSETTLTKKQAKKAGLDKIIYPKGTFSVLALQEKNIYLATFPTKKVKKTVIDNSSLAARLTGLSSVFGEMKTVVEEELPESSKSLNLTESIGIKIDEFIKVGDFIAKSS